MRVLLYVMPMKRPLDYHEEQVGVVHGLPSLVRDLFRADQWLEFSMFTDGLSSVSEISRDCLTT